MNPLYPKTWLFAKFGWNQPHGSGEEDEKVYRQTDGKKVEVSLKKKEKKRDCLIHMHGNQS